MTACAAVGTRWRRLLYTHKQNPSPDAQSWPAHRELPRHQPVSIWLLDSQKHAGTRLHGEQPRRQANVSDAAAVNSRVAVGACGGWRVTNTLRHEHGALWPRQGARKQQGCQTWAAEGNPFTAAANPGRIGGFLSQSCISWLRDSRPYPAPPPCIRSRRAPRARSANGGRWMVGGSPGGDYPLSEKAKPCFFSHFSTPLPSSSPFELNN